MYMLPLLLAQTEAAEPATQSLLDRLGDDQLFVVLLVAIGCGTAIIIALFAISAGVWNSTRQKQVEAELKQDMLDRGMSADEIEKVVKAQPKEGLDHWMEVWAKKKGR